MNAIEARNILDIINILLATHFGKTPAYIMFWGYALEACATDQPTGFGRFSLVRRRYRRHLHRPFMFYLISLGS
jgi:hypothetical protein